MLLILGEYTLSKKNDFQMIFLHDENCDIHLSSRFYGGFALPLMCGDRINPV